MYNVYMLFRVSLRELNDGRWRLELRTTKAFKPVEYDNFETAVKELQRVIEIRDTSDRWPEFLKKAKKTGGR